MRYVKRHISNAKSTTCKMGGIVARMMDECLGDIAAYIAVSNHYDRVLTVEDMNEKLKE